MRRKNPLSRMLGAGEFFQSSSLDLLDVQSSWLGPLGGFVGTAVGIMGTKVQRWENRGARWRITRRPLVFQQGLQPSASDTVLSFQAEDLTRQQRPAAVWATGGRSVGCHRLMTFNVQWKGSQSSVTQMGRRLAPREMFLATLAVSKICC